MKNTFKLIAIGAIALNIGTSCNSYKHTYRTSDIPEKNVVVADRIGVELIVDANKVVEASSKKRHKSPSDAKNEAYYNAITNNNIHVLVDPIYRTQTTARILIFGGTSTSTVTGFAGYYENARSYQEVKEELDNEKIQRQQAAFELAVQQMKQLKDEGMIKATTSVNVSEKKTSNLENIDNLETLKLTTLNVDMEYELTKTTETSSLVDEYNNFLKGMKNPSSVGFDIISNDSAAKEEITILKNSWIKRLQFWKKK
jgi:hypothetical protein